MIRSPGDEPGFLFVDKTSSEFFSSKLCIANCPLVFGSCALYFLPCAFVFWIFLLVP